MIEAEQIVNFVGGIVCNSQTRGRSKRGPMQKDASEGAKERKRAQSQKNAKERRRAQKGTKECKRAQKSAKERKRALPLKNCKQPGLKQPGLLGTPEVGHRVTDLQVCKFIQSLALTLAPGFSELSG